MFIERMIAQERKKEREKQWRTRYLNTEIILYIFCRSKD